MTKPDKEDTGLKNVSERRKMKKMERETKIKKCYLKNRDKERVRERERERERERVCV